MSDYKRLTIRNSDGSVSQPTHSTCEKVFNRLAELEDKIERGELVENKIITHVNMARSNGKTLIQKALWYDELKAKIEQGTLIELPISDRYILEDYAHIMFDSWNDTTGAIHKGRSWYDEVLSVIDDIVGMVYGITARQYEAKLKELQE